MNKILGTWVIACSAWGFAASAEAGQKWIHVRVDGSGEDETRVDVQVPVELVSTLLPAIKGKHGGPGVHVAGNSVEIAELRSYWNAVREAKDGEYVTVRDAHSDVRISKSGGFLRLLVNDQGGGGRVRMTLPVSFVDGVLAAGDTIDLDAIGTALQKAPLGDLLTVDDEDSHIRIWIDTEVAPAREGGR